MNLEEERFQADNAHDLGFIFPIINGKVSMAINRMMYRNFRKHGLDITPEQWTVLSFLWQKDGVTQQMLCNSTYKDKPSMTRLIDNLVKQDLVCRNTSLQDRRANYIYLTSEGKYIKERANMAVDETMAAALAGIDDEGMGHVRSILSVVFANISEALEAK